MKNCFLLLIKSVLIFCLLLASSGFSQRGNSNSSTNESIWIDIYEESIRVIIHNDEIEVNSKYGLRNNTNGQINLTLQFPLQIDKYHPFPYEINVRHLNHRKDSTNIFVNLTIKPKENKIFSLNYKQKYNKKQITLILSSLHHWRRPIEKAEFIISFPKYINNIKMSFQYVRLVELYDRKTYYITRQNFLPDDNLNINWN